jgi:hypothetical protein
MRKLTKSLLMATAAAAVMSGVQAQAYTDGDLLVGFRVQGVNANGDTTYGANDVVYDLGSYLNYDYLANASLAGSKITLNQFSTINPFGATALNTTANVDFSVLARETATGKTLLLSQTRSSSQTDSTVAGSTGSKAWEIQVNQRPPPTLPASDWAPLMAQRLPRASRRRPTIPAVVPHHPTTIS